MVLREVEAALLACEGVAEAAVVAQERPDGDKRLVAYIVPADSAPVAVEDVRQTLAQTLTDYMILARFVTVDALLLTPAARRTAGDWSALPIPFERPNLGVPYVPPGTEVESMIAGIWAEVLELDSAAVGMDDPFFDLGGNSILAARILARLNQTLGIAPPFELLVANGTPAALAAAIQRE